MSLLTFAKRVAGRDGAVRASVPEAAADVAATPTPQVAGVLAARIGLLPIITEKAITLQGANVLAFRVRSQVTKGQVKAAIFQRYGIRPVKVRSGQVRAKLRRRGQTQGWTNDWKKVYVQLPEGKSIDVTA